MELLSAQSFSDALMRCYENQRYKVGIAFSSTVTYIPFINELQREQKETKMPGVIRFDIMSNGGRILFDNGSCVDMFVTTQNQRGRKCNEILYDGNIETEILNTVLRPMLITYRNLKDYVNVDFYVEESDELDDFIKSFKIDPEKRCSAT